jgi:hypothetical protein
MYGELKRTVEKMCVACFKVSEGTEENNESQINQDSQCTNKDSNMTPPWKKVGDIYHLR